MHYSETISASPSAFHFFLDTMENLSLLSLSKVMVPPVVSLVSLPPQQAYNAKLGFPMRAR